MIGGAANMKGFKLSNASRLLVYKLGGKVQLPAAPEMQRPPMSPPPATVAADVIARGAPLYDIYCRTCHGAGVIGVGLLPDLRRTALLHSAENWEQVVIGGALKARGMASFARVIRMRLGPAQRLSDAPAGGHDHHDRGELVSQREGDELPGPAGRSGRDDDVLLAAHGIRHGYAGLLQAQIHLPDDLPATLVMRAEFRPTLALAGKQQLFMIAHVIWCIASGRPKGPARRLLAVRMKSRFESPILSVDPQNLMNPGELGL